jgi:teichoic acid transport system permease protein
MEMRDSDPGGTGSWPSTFDDEGFESPPLDLGGHLSHGAYLGRTFANPDFLIRYPVTVLRAKYRETLLGIGWEVLNPALLVLVWWIIRGVVFPATGGTDYLEFLVVSIFTYQFLQRFVLSGQSAISSSKGLLQSFNFPPLVAVLQQSVTVFVSNFFSIGVLLVFLLVAGERPTIPWLAYPLIVIMQASFAVGGSLILARLTSQSPDVRNMVPFIFRLLFYASGVIFPIDDRIEGRTIRWLFEVNPFYSITALTRTVLLGDSIDSITLVSAMSWAVLLPLFGYLIFRSGDDRYAV